MPHTEFQMLLPFIVSKCFTEKKMWITITTKYTENCWSKFKPDTQVMLKGKGAKI